jgi:dihydrofolate synthase/folylpolyglutamate synthase
MLFGMKAGLGNIRELCARLGNPQESWASIHVVGTNGKGSTSFWLMKILEAHGLRVGLFTSPHLVSMRERIRVGDLAISTSDLERHISTIHEAGSDLEPTFFEVLTAVAFLWFRDQNPDFVVLEAGLGGRLDSTNLKDSGLSILTSIGLDHTEILGDSLVSILAEKIGVWRPGATLFHNLSDDVLCANIDAYGNQLPGIPVLVPCKDDLLLPQAGRVYQENASLSWACAQKILGSRFDGVLARKALASSVWAGRQQELRNPLTGAVDWILDGAHNGHAAIRLAENLRAKFPAQKIPLILAVLKTKNPLEIIQPLLPHISEVLLTRTPHPKMRNPEEMASMFGDLPVRIIPNAIEALEQVSPQHGPVLCTGSLYFVGLVVEQLKSSYSELDWFRQFAPNQNELK